MTNQVSEETLNELFGDSRGVVGNQVVTHHVSPTRMEDVLSDRLRAEDSERQEFALLRSGCGLLPVGMSVAEAAVKLERISQDNRRQFIESAWKFSELENYRQ